jgi:hypothetical protein
MSTEDPDLVHRSTKAARRRAKTADVMRELTKVDRLYAKAAALAKASAIRERRLHRLLADMTLPARPN